MKHAPETLCCEKGESEPAWYIFKRLKSHDARWSVFASSRLCRRPSDTSATALHTVKDGPSEAPASASAIQSCGGLLRNILWTSLSFTFTILTLLFWDFGCEIFLSLSKLLKNKNPFNYLIPYQLRAGTKKN